MKQSCLFRFTKSQKAKPKNAPGEPEQPEKALNNILSAMRILVSLLVFLALNGQTPVASQTSFQVPPNEILELADVKAPSIPSISPGNQYMALLERSLYRDLEELAQEELRLAGLRINPDNFNASRTRYYTDIQLQRLSDNTTIDIQGLPENLKIQSFSFSPDDKMCAFIQAQPNQLALWVIDLATGKAQCVLSEGINGTMGTPFIWGNSSEYLFCRYKDAKQKLPAKKELATGPATQDATGDAAPARTYQDLLRNQQDEIVFDHYTKSAYLKVFTNGAPAMQILPEALYKRFSLSPNGAYILTEEVQKPYSYTLTYRSFPSKYNIYTSAGDFIKTFYTRPLQDKIPISFDATEGGKRFIFWRADKPNTLIWAEAPDGGNPEVKSEVRDEIFESPFPFEHEQSLCKIKNRLANIEFGKDGCLIITDYWRKNRNTKTYFFDPSLKSSSPRIIFDRSSEDLYSEPGSFVTMRNEYNQDVLKYTKDGKKLYLTGEGYSHQGNRPFIDEYELATGKTRRLWQADGLSTYERVVRIVDADKKTAITSIEAPTVFPNLFFRRFGSKAKPQQITFRENPYKALENITKQKIYYQRDDGVQLSANLYLPAGFNKKRDGRLPLLMEAYPTEYKDDKAAGQIKESPHAFIGINWASPIFWVTRGFAVLEDAQFPIIGKGDKEPNDTYIKQLVANAQAAIQAVDSLEVVDPARCAVMGHSYGAFMTANLLAHSDLFAAGLARSGAYNRSLTPFGFQAEERTYWQAKEIYDQMSPFNYAHQLKTPILLIHGDADNNSGTFTFQSERMFQAIKGNGGVSRLVLLPYESHSYAARENILHMLWEMDSWLIKYVKNK